MHKAHLILVLILFSLTCAVEAKHSDLEYRYFLDKSGMMDIKAAEELSEDKWLNAHEEIVSFNLAHPDYLSGTRGAHVWLKIMLPDKARLDRIWLELLPNVGLNGKLATMNAGQWNWHQPVGVQGAPFENMPARYLTFIIDTSIENKVAYIKLSTDQIFHFLIRARTLDKLPKYFIEQSLFVGFIFGILILAIVYNGTIGISAREPSFIYYAIYEICVTIYLASVSGYMHVFIKDWSPGGTPNNFGVIISALSAFFFVRSLLDTKSMQPRYDLALRIVTAFIFLSVILVLILPNYISYPLTEFIGLSCPALILWAGFRAYRLGHPLALYFLGAWTLFLCVAATWAWMWLGFIEPSETMLRALLAGAALEALLLSLILGFRYSHLKRRAEDQVVEISNYQTLSETDELTGILNRRGLLNQVQELIDDQSPFVWAAIDVDHFKKFNDTHGHFAGDQLLEKLGELFQKEVRSADIAGRWDLENDEDHHHNLAGRVGGEEFAVILADCKLEQAEQFLNRLTKAFNNTTVTLSNGKMASTTLSIGATEYLPGEDLETTWKRADKLLYEAKNAGRNTSILRNAAA